MIPRHRSGQSFDDHQREMAEWMGCSVDEMNSSHDLLHADLCAWLGVPSYALDPASAHTELAGMEEAAVLMIQRFITHARKSC